MNFIHTVFDSENKYEYYSCRILMNIFKYSNIATPSINRKSYGKF